MINASTELTKVLHAMPSEVRIVNGFFKKSLGDKPASQITPAVQNDIVSSALADQHVRGALDHIGKKLKPHAGIEPDLPIEAVLVFGILVTLLGIYFIEVYVVNRP